MINEEVRRQIVLAYLKHEQPWSEERIHAASYDIPWIIDTIGGMDRR